MNKAEQDFFVEVNNIFGKVLGIISGSDAAGTMLVTLKSYLASCIEPGSDRHNSITGLVSLILQRSTSLDTGRQKKTEISKLEAHFGLIPKEVIGIFQEWHGKIPSSFKSEEEVEKLAQELKAEIPQKIDEFRRQLEILREKSDELRYAIYELLEGESRESGNDFDGSSIGSDQTFEDALGGDSTGTGSSVSVMDPPKEDLGTDKEPETDPVISEEVQRETLIAAVVETLTASNRDIGSYRKANSGTVNDELVRSSNELLKAATEHLTRLGALPQPQQQAIEVEKELIEQLSLAQRSLSKYIPSSVEFTKSCIDYYTFLRSICVLVEKLGLGEHSIDIGRIDREAVGVEVERELNEYGKCKARLEYELNLVEKLQQIADNLGRKQNIEEAINALSELSVEEGQILGYDYYPNVKNAEAAMRKIFAAIDDRIKGFATAESNKAVLENALSGISTATQRIFKSTQPNKTESQVYKNLMRELEQMSERLKAVGIVEDFAPDPEASGALSCPEPRVVIMEPQAEATVGPQMKESVDNTIPTVEQPPTGATIEPQAEELENGSPNAQPQQPQAHRTPVQIRSDKKWSYIATAGAIGAAGGLFISAGVLIFIAADVVKFDPLKIFQEWNNPTNIGVNVAFIASISLIIAGAVMLSLGICNSDRKLLPPTSHANHHGHSSEEGYNGGSRRSSVEYQPVATAAQGRSSSSGDTDPGIETPPRAGVYSVGSVAPLKGPVVEL